MSSNSAAATTATIGIDLGKNTFHLVGLDRRGAIVLQLKLSRGQLWTLRCGSHDLDIEGHVDGVPGYQELLYETTRFEPVAEGFRRYLE